MYRNLSKRVEVVIPILAKGPKKKLWEVLEICLRDHRQAWVLGIDAIYQQLHPDRNSNEQGPETLGTHRTLMDLTKARLAV